MSISDAQRLNALEAENTQLKRLLAESMLNNAALKDIACQSQACCRFTVLPFYRVAALHLMAAHQLGISRTCRLIVISRSNYRYQSQRQNDISLKARLYDSANLKQRYGYRWLHIL